MGSHLSLGEGTGDIAAAVDIGYSGGAGVRGRKGYLGTELCPTLHNWAQARNCSKQTGDLGMFLSSPSLERELRLGLVRETFGACARSCEPTHLRRRKKMGCC